MASPVSSAATLIKELNWLGKNGEYDKALKTANKILQEHPSLEEVWSCKVVCLVHKNRFEDALSCIRKNFSSTDVSFLKAYCEYRLNRCEDALKTLSTATNPSDLRIRELYGQIYYKMESFQESYSIYRELIKNTQDDFEDEREANLSATLAAIHLWTEQDDLEDIDLRDNTYEMLYNSACMLIGRGMHQSALDLLQRSEEVCKETLDEQDGLEAELAFIRVQRGYVLQMMGRNDEALKLYNQVIKLKSSDPLVLAVACNNIVTINKDQSMFDSKKKIKTATSSDLRHKLSSCQKQAIALNECLLLMYSGQGDQCSRSVAALEGSCEEACLVGACKLLRDKQHQQAVLYLQECIKKRGGGGGKLQYAVAQVLMEQDKLQEACEALKQLGDDTYSPGVTSSLVSLYEKQGDEESASQAIDTAVQWHLSNNAGSEEVSVLMRASANIQLSAGKPQLAANMLEELRKLNPGDLKLLAQLILAYSKFDAKKAHLVSRQFPASEDLLASVDVSALESPNHFVSKWTRKPHKTASPHKKAGVVTKKKPKKKKKKLLPKNYDPSVPADPERWMPLKERSTYRGRRRNRRKEIGKGTQGATSTAFPELNASESPKNSEIGSPKVETPQAPRLQRPAGGANKQKNKKKKGNKW